MYGLVLQTVHKTEYLHKVTVVMRVLDNKVKRELTNTKCLCTELQTLVNKNGIDKATLTCVRRVHRLY